MLKSLPFKVLFIFLLVFSFSILFSRGISDNLILGIFDAVEAQDPYPEEPPPEEVPPPEEPPPEEAPCEPCYSTSYYCTSGCDGQLIEVVCEECCGGGCSETLIEDCNPWQMCDASALSCSCEGQCLETPKNPRYYNNPTYSDKPDKDIGNSNIKLPVKLDWDDVAGWGQSDGPQSYIINIENTPSASGVMLNESEFLPSSCSLKSNSTYPWQVKACCDADPTNCGSESSWNFNTDLAPEPISPYDPDWAGEKQKKNTLVPITFDWCDVNEAKLYLLELCAAESFWERFSSFWTSKREEAGQYCSRPELIPAKTEEGKFFPSEQIFGLGVLTKEQIYEWQVYTCTGETDESCQNSSQLWKFETGNPVLPPPELISPKSQNNVIPTVNLSTFLKWEQGPGATSYRYEIKKGGALVFNDYTDLLNIPFSSFWNFLSFNTDYEWRVKSCWEKDGVDCEEFGNPENFKTTGAPPTNLREESIDNEGKISVPAKLDWDDMPGAASYRYRVASDSGFNNIVAQGVTNSSVSEVLVNYPDLLAETNYWWQVKTCADNQGNVCGQSAIQSFTTFKLPIPHSPDPEDGGTIFADSPIKVAPLAAKFYQYKIEYISQPPEEKKEICPSLVGQEVVPPTIAQSSSFYPSLECLGNYRWQVRTCLDKDCQAPGVWSSWWSFTVIQPTPTAWGGIVPCGRSYDDPNTPWNERESCQFKHIFLIIKIVIDFLLFRLAPLSLVLLTIATGIMFYFSISTGGTSPIIRVKRLWKSAGIGLGIIFFAWSIINWLLSILGFQVGIFGQWWQIPL